jgi:hypothetical protein
MDTIYLESEDGDLYTSFLRNGTWQSLQKLNGYINDGSPVRNPVISKDRKRLYFSSWRGGYGGWDVYCSKWDSSTKDWGPAENLGPNINGPGGGYDDYFAYELSPDTLYIINDRWAGMGLCIYIKDKLSNDWKIIDSSNYHHPFGAGFIWGLSLTPDRRKAYFGRYINDSLQTELHVTYWDTLNNRWGDTYRLNINSVAYKVKVTDIYYTWKGGLDEFPWISPDGKTLYFTSNRDRVKIDSNSAAADIYVSHLIVDDNGDSVTAVSETNRKNSTNSLRLLPNYPNPFNPSTKISFSLETPGHIKIIIYDNLGRKVRKLADSYFPSGSNTVTWDGRDEEGNNLPSGVYYYSLLTDKDNIVKKMILLK